MQPKQTRDRRNTSPRNASRARYTEKKLALSAPSDEDNPIAWLQLMNELEADAVRFIL